MTKLIIEEDPELLTNLHKFDIPWSENAGNELKLSVCHPVPQKASCHVSIDRESSKLHHTVRDLPSEWSFENLYEDMDDICLYEI